MTSVYYANCSEVRAAGQAPLYSSDPGYADHLDGDGDGIACETSGSSSGSGSSGDGSSGTGSTTQATRPQNFAGSGGSVYYKNCTAARAAGAAPILRGEPGYASHLDRDDDGVACE